MGYIEAALVGSLGGAVVGLAYVLIKPAKLCPQCGTTLPKLQFMSPAKRKRVGILKGGVVCKQCGCGVDAKGNMVSQPTQIAPVAQSNANASHAK
ncbi:hypothetical protein KNO81_39375 [Paraburkholderia sediminicola]|jgi:hypothetical protein|nr:hypothetical protein [Paraburkholderia sediminicola]